VPLVHECTARGCSTLTMGSYCLAHEENEPRSRRLLAVAASAAAIAGFAAAFVARHV
jgi:hypothetical protein